MEGRQDAQGGSPGADTLPLGGHIAFLAKGLSALAAGHLEEAVRMFREMTRADPIGKAVLEGVLRDLEKGEGGLSLAIERQQKNFDIRTGRGIYRFAKALVHSLDGGDLGPDCRGALDDFVAAAALRPEHAPARVNRANVLIFGGRCARDSHSDPSSIFRMALKDLDEAVSFDSRSSPARHNRGIAHFYIGGIVRRVGEDAEPHFRSAIDDFTAAAGLQPEYPYLHKDLGVVKIALAKYLASKDRSFGALFNEAAGHLDVACSLDGTLFAAFYARGQARFAIKDFKGAEQDYVRCMQIDPAREVVKLKGLLEEARRLIGAA